MASSAKQIIEDLASPTHGKKKKGGSPRHLPQDHIGSSKLPASPTRKPVRKMLENQSTEVFMTMATSVQYKSD
jgi:hypothetical protein